MGIYFVHDPGAVIIVRHIVNNAAIGIIGVEPDTGAVIIGGFAVLNRDTDVARDAFRTARVPPGIEMPGIVPIHQAAVSLAVGAF